MGIGWDGGKHFEIGMKTVKRIALCLLWMSVTLAGVYAIAIGVMDPKTAILYHGDYHIRAGSSGYFYVFVMGLTLIVVGVFKLRDLFRRNR